MGWRVADSRWRERGFRPFDPHLLHKEKCLGLNYAAFLTRTGDWCLVPLMLGHHISSCVWYVLCFYCSACLSASSLNFFSLDYQHCNWVRELCRPETAAQTCFCWNSSKLSAQLWKVNKTTHAQPLVYVKGVCALFTLQLKTTHKRESVCDLQFFLNLKSGAPAIFPSEFNEAETKERNLPKWCLPFS